MKLLSRSLSLLLALVLSVSALPIAAFASEAEADTPPLIIATQTSSANPSSKKLAAPAIKKLQNTKTGVKITIGKVNGATQYRVFYKTGTGSWKRAGDTKSDTLLWNKAKHGTTYTFTVRCLDKNGKVISDYNKTGKSILFLKAPTLTGAKSSKPRNMTVTWKKLGGVSGYEIQFSTSKSFKSGNSTVKAKASAVSRTVGSLKAGKTYYVRIRAFRTVSGRTFRSVWSGAKAVTIQKTSSGKQTSSVSTTVYITPTGEKYHRSSCRTLSRSKTIYDISKSEAQSRGYDACKVCRP